MGMHRAPLLIPRVLDPGAVALAAEGHKLADSR